MNRALSSLQHVDVVDEDGKRLGRLRELRCRGGPARGRGPPSARVVAIVYGMPGLFESLGFAASHECEVATRHVVRWERDRVVVRRGAGARKRR